MRAIKQKMKALVRLAAGPLANSARGRKLARKLGLIPEPSQLAAILEIFAEVSKKTFFIQVGSNDASHGDPLKGFILAHGWRGIMIEPVPYVFERLKLKWGGQPGLILENLAIADSDGTKRFYYPVQNHDPSLPPWYDQLGSFRLETLLSPAHVGQIPDLATRIKVADVPCLTFESLCKKRGVEAVDLVHIDTEGYDYEVVRLIDFEKHRPQLVVYENKHLSTTEKAACAQLLANHGYDVLDCWPDSIAISKECQARITRLRDFVTCK